MRSLATTNCPGRRSSTSAKRAPAWNGTSSNTKATLTHHWSASRKRWKSCGVGENVERPLCRSSRGNEAHLSHLVTDDSRASLRRLLLLQQASLTVPFYFPALPESPALFSSANA